MSSATPAPDEQARDTSRHDRGPNLGRGAIPRLAGRLRRWWVERGIGTQLLTAVNSLCLLLAIAFLTIDYRREIDRLVEARRKSLTEEAVIVQTAIRDIQHHGEEAVQQYVDTVCHRISSGDAPGHHVAVRFGDYVMQSQSHGPASIAMFESIETASRNKDYRGVFGARSIVVGSATDGNRHVYVSEYVDDIRRFVRGEALARLGRLTLLAIVAGVVVNTLLLRLFVSPLDRMIAAVGRIGGGEFDIQIENATNRELQHLATAVNDMSASLGAAQQRRTAQLEKARCIQEHLLPKSIPIAGLSIGALYEPAEEVAGDYYDHIALPDGSALLWLADVSGHGIPAAMAASMLKSLLTTAVEQVTSTRDIMQFVNRHFCAATLPETFATAVAVRFSRRQGSTLLEFANAGHPFPLLLKQTGESSTLHSTGLPLGVAPDADWNQGTCHMSAGDRLVLYSDGVIETFDEAGTCFGQRRLTNLLRKNCDVSPDHFTRSLSQALSEFRGPHAADDDVTAVVVGCNDEPET